MLLLGSGILGFGVFGLGGRSFRGCIISDRMKHLSIFDTCNVSFYLEIDSDYVISKSEGHLALTFLQFCNKCDICNEN